MTLPRKPQMHFWSHTVVFGGPAVMLFRNLREQCAAAWDVFARPKPSAAANGPFKMPGTVPNLFRCGLRLQRNGDGKLVGGRDDRGCANRSWIPPTRYTPSRPIGWQCRRLHQRAPMPPRSDATPWETRGFPPPGLLAGACKVHANERPSSSVECRQAYVTDHAARRPKSPSAKLAKTGIVYRHGPRSRESRHRVLEKRDTAPNQLCWNDSAHDSKTQRSGLAVPSAAFFAKLPVRIWLQRR